MQLAHPITLALIALVDALRHHAGGLIAPLQQQKMVDRKAIDASIESVSERITKSPVYGFIQMLVREPSIGCLPAGPRFGVSQDSTTNVTTLRMELPGVSADDLDVSLENEILLRIQSDHRKLVDGSVVELHHYFQLDDDVDPASLQVALQEGMLEVTASQKAKPVKRLQVKTTNSRDAAINTQTTLA